MTELSRGRLAIKYIIFELLPVFLVGLSIFIFVLIMIQSFKLSEYIIVHGAKLETMIQLVFYMMLGYLPILFPIAILFAVLFVYGRMSGDSEIVAFKALGLTPLHLTVPVVVVGLAISLLSLQTSFRLAPWGQRNLNNLINVLAQTRPGASIREGVFSQGFFDLVVYANQVDSKSGKLSKIFIFDERDPNSPVTIISKEGQLLNSNSINGQEAYLRLLRGDLHKSSEDSYTKINFDSYNINLFDPHDVKESRTSPNSLNLNELKAAMKNNELGQKLKTNLYLEWHRRWSLSAACLIFAFLGVSLGTVTNKRTARSGSMVICISAIVIYWTIYVAFESFARAGHIPTSVAAWTANICFVAFAMFHFRRIIES